MISIGFAGYSLTPQAWLLAGQEHGVTVTEKPVTLLYRLAISRHNVFIAGESTDQHDQRRLGQMEIGHHRVHCLEAVAGIDEDIGFATKSRKNAVITGRLKRANRYSAHRHHATATSTGLNHRVYGLLGNLGNFAVHNVIMDILHPDRLEGTRTHVQRYIGKLNTLGPEGFQQGIVKV